MDLTGLPLWANSLLVFGLIFALMATGIWIAFALGAVGLIGLIFLAGGMEETVSSILFQAINDFVLVAIPLFIFMGEVILKSGLSTRLYRGVSRWTGIIPGGLTHSNIVACSIFAAVSGSSVATAATIGTVALGEQEARGYDRRLILGSVAAGGTLGILIPPSITMILYGAFMGVSVARLFIGGVIPGLLLAGMFMAWIFIASILRPQWAPGRDKFSWAYFPRALGAIKDIWPMLILIFIIMGGIYTGFMTPTEAAAVSAFVALVLVAVHGRLNFTLLKEATLSSLRTTAMVLLILVGARILTTSMSMIRLPAKMSDFILDFELDRMAIWAFIVVMYLILGCFMEGISMMLLTLPVTFPLLVTGLGFNPIWFGVLLTVLIEAALITPPVGINLFVIHGISGGKRFGDVVIGSIPFFFIMCIAIVIYSLWPWLVTWLPTTMMG